MKPDSRFHPVAERLREIRRSVRGFEGLLAGIAGLSVIVAVLEAASIAVLVPLLQAFKSRAASALVQLALVAALLVLLRGGTSYANELLAVRLHLRVLLGLRERLARAFYDARHADLAALGPGRLVNLFSVQTERVASALSSLLSLANAGLLIVVYGAALVVLSWRLSLAAGLLMLAGVAVAAYTRRRILERAAHMVHAEEESSSLASDDAAGLSVIQAYGVGAERLALHRRVNQAVYRETMALHRWRGAARPLSEAVFIMVVLVALGAALAVDGERLFDMAPVILTFAFVLHRFQGQVTTVLDAASGLAEQEGASANVFAFLREGRPRATEGAPLRTVERVDLEHLAFAYREGEPVLEGLDLVLTRGEVVAVVGESGAGKSTLVHLLARLREPGSGKILLDGTPLDRITAADLARGVGVVFEDAFVFDESVEWNISLGRDLPAGALRQAARVAALDGVVDDLPDGYATRVGPGGTRLSAGQRQRLALARALAGGPPVLILDEATSALDGPTEQSVAAAVRAARPEGITLVIAHRLSTVLGADRIAVLHGGRIVACGAHADLLQSNGVYRRLVENQVIADVGV